MKPKKGVLVSGRIQPAWNPLLLADVSPFILRRVIPPLEHIDWYRFLKRAPLACPPFRVVGDEGRAPILITGAGGSIGSALAVRLKREGASLVLLEASEAALNELQRSLAALNASALTSFYLGSAADRALLEQIFAEHNPQLVLHAAAFKHVPLLEAQPFAAIANNILATETVVKVANENRALVPMLSTDKAVEPSSLMGATKYVAEQIVLSSGGTVVRLANVLASRGSVCEVFAGQLAAGGPLTVTDPEAQRYFITIEEAVELLCAAAFRADRGALYVPRLTVPYYISDLARFMAECLAPSREIPIVFTGLRAGEKIVEQLWSTHESPSEEAVGGLLRLKPALISKRLLWDSLKELEGRVASRDLSGALSLIRELVPDYKPSTVMLQHQSPVHHG